MSYTKLPQQEQVSPRSLKRFFTNRTLKAACKEGNLVLLNDLLDEGQDPSKGNNEAFRIAAKYGRLHIVKELLQDPRVDPTAKENEALLSAVQNLHIGVIEELLSDSRVEVTGKALWAALLLENDTVVHMLTAATNKQGGIYTQAKEWPKKKVFTRWLSKTL